MHSSKNAFCSPRRLLQIGPRKPQCIQEGYSVYAKSAKHQTGVLSVKRIRADAANRVWGTLMTVGWDETGVPARWQGHHARAGRRAVSRKMAEPVEWTPPKCWFRLTRSWLFDGLCLRLRRGRLRGVRLVLCGELLPDPGGDGVHVHLVEVGGILEHSAGVARGMRRVENGDLNQEATENAYLCLSNESRE